LSGDKLKGIKLLTEKQEQSFQIKTGSTKCRRYNKEENVENNREDEKDHIKKGITRRGFLKTAVMTGAAIGVENVISKNAKTTGVITKNTIDLTVNGEKHELEIGDQPDEVQPHHTLDHTLRNTLGLTGTKVSCEQGACGCCTVIMGGKPVLSCTILTIECDGKSVMTVEGLEDAKTGKLDPLQEAFIDNSAFQCGFCTPGILMSSKGLLMRSPSPSVEEVKSALSGNFCRCISHYHVVDAVMTAAKRR